MSDLFITVTAIVIICVLLFAFRKKIVLSGLFPLIYIAMLRTGIGLKHMERIAKRFPRFFTGLYTVGIFLGFIGMALIVFELVRVTISLFHGGASGVVPVLPIEAKGVFYVPFLYWIISIFVIAFVHEFSHGIASQAFGIPVKSSGIAFLCLVLPVVPAAFVEPDETALKRKSARAQLGVFAAGAFANLIFGFLFLGLALGTAAYTNHIMPPQGAAITLITPDSPAALSGIPNHATITAVDEKQIHSTQDLMYVLSASHPGQTWSVRTDDKEYSLVLGSRSDDVGVAYMGLNIEDKIVADTFLKQALAWILGLLRWLFALNIGIALFNLLPIGPLDGGRMLMLILEKKQKIFHMISTFVLLLVVVNIVSGFI